MKTIKIKELGIEVEVEVSEKVLRDDVKGKIKEGWRLLSECRKEDFVNEKMFLINHFEKELNYLDEWEWLEQPFKVNVTKYPFCLRGLYRGRGLNLDADNDNLPISNGAGRVRLCRNSADKVEKRYDQDMCLMVQQSKELNELDEEIKALKEQFKSLEQWLQNKNREKSNIAFTEGSLRRIAYLIEEQLSNSILIEDVERVIDEWLEIKNGDHVIKFNNLYQAQRIKQKLKSLKKWH